jgi:PAS domain-containing protein
MFGQHRAAHIGIPFSAYVDKNDVKQYLDYLQQCREAETTVSTELRLVCRPGISLDVELHGLPVRGSLHRRFGYRIAIADLTSRNTTREELCLMQAVHEHCREAVVICDNRNYILSVNGAFSRITGHASREVLGRHAELIGTPAASGEPVAGRAKYRAGAKMANVTRSGTPLPR